MIKYLTITRLKYTFLLIFCSIGIGNQRQQMNMQRNTIRDAYRNLEISSWYRCKGNISALLVVLNLVSIS